MGPGEFLRNHFRFFRLWILERDTRSGGADSAADTPADVEVRVLNRVERRDWICSHASDAEWPQFRAALQHDHDLVVAKRDKTTVAWAWIGYERVFLTPLGREILVPAGTAYLYESYVRPSARRRGIGAALVAARCRRAAQVQCERLLTHVVDGNSASLRALRAHGFEVTGRTFFVKALALRMWTRSPLPATPTGTRVVPARLA